MVYIFGNFLNKKKRVLLGFTKIYGLGVFQSKLILNFANIGKNLKIKELSQNKIILLCKKIDQIKVLIELQLKVVLNLEKKSLIVIKCFRGLNKNVK
jgi:small subunit ribosomal protein S13